jgi:hypothetical protein
MISPMTRPNLVDGLLKYCLAIRRIATFEEKKSGDNCVSSF